MDERRLRWLCRRGMKELDVLLTRYMDARWPQAGEAERAAFARLLELQDPELWVLLTESDRGAKAPLLRSANRGAKAPLLWSADRGAREGTQAHAPLQRDLEDVVERIRNLPEA